MKKIFAKFLLIFFFSSSAFAASVQNFIIAKINNKALTSLELLDRFHFIILSSKIKIDSSSDRKLLLEQILDKMIDEELIRQEAAILKIETNREEINNAVEVFALRQKKNEAQLKLFFVKNGLSFDNFLQQVESEILWSKLISEVLRSKVKVADTEVMELLEQHKFSVNVKKFFIAEIVIAKSSKNAAQFASKMAIELRQGADFKSLVRQFSSALNSENSGEIGWVTPNEVDAKIYAELSKLEKGGYSAPVDLADGFHIFKLLDVKVEKSLKEQDFNAAKNVIFSHKLQTYAKGYLMDLRKKSFIEISRLSEL